MIRKAFAALLLTLVALPFTAPFSTCDASTLFGDGTTGIPHRSPLAPSLDEGGHGFPLVGSLGRLRFRFAWDVHHSDRAPGVVGLTVNIAHGTAPAIPQFARDSLVALRI